MSGQCTKYLTHVIRDHILQHLLQRTLYCVRYFLSKQIQVIFHNDICVCVCVFWGSVNAAIQVFLPFIDNHENEQQTL